MCWWMWAAATGRSIMGRGCHLRRLSRCARATSLSLARPSLRWNLRRQPFRQSRQLQRRRRPHSCHRSRWGFLLRQCRPILGRLRSQPRPRQWPRIGDHPRSLAVHLLILLGPIRRTLLLALTRGILQPRRQAIILVNSPRRASREGIRVRQVGRVALLLPDRASGVAC